jgi:hypothetical protein
MILAASWALLGCAFLILFWNGWCVIRRLGGIRVSSGIPVVATFLAFVFLSFQYAAGGVSHIELALTVMLIDGLIIAIHLVLRRRSGN